ncbi:MAG: hypothetical protein ACKO3K_03795 [Cuspidothrix sp.]
MVSCIGVATFVPYLFTVASIKEAQAQSFSRNRKDLNGLLIRNPGTGAIYWVDRGQRRHISGPSIYTSLFEPRDRDYLDTDAVEEGLPITNDNRLVRCGERNHSLFGRIYLLDNGTKRHIVSPSVMRKNNFKGAGNIDCPVLTSIPDGDSIR